MLPTVEDVSATFTWVEEELQYLEGSPARQATASMQDKLKREHASILAQYPQLDPQVFTLERWTWAFSNLFSRARLKAGRVDEFLALVPYIDFINHSPPFVVSQHRFSSFVRRRARHPQGLPLGGRGGRGCLFADRAYKQFDQIFISVRPAAEFLIYSCCTASRSIGIPSTPST